ncbi:nucleoside transporter, NupC family protein [Clostridium argentinense CDC 2741]|uniref:Nucleoside permease n=1 Tax=Clostridium argentinense CDC 2741 TaxID=1418104 RepID=A0A0C1R6B0_9CLOT|nr:NupC/NupG family nucleoside CNT transporter [Clostridium argentinense]ARC83574.1 NupC/NupG family nucleoside CNT transporter [Clostridium argentinense]KIE46001.1 nucleoside transporter, NupC family protein [Clostridium argentinense CDC 2741]NFF40542.1 NupC/NupG family nucleoside CNT transporter [Clostridium argentinense]NFP50860.1 NupC/NupG family nucleoside CNT transporter [Clostridium argentinense]NFP74091.1 NupC/NupG family nucleoside CNT transporter [Clostridium argentinense]
MDKIIGIFGLAIFILIAYLFSTNRKKVDWKLVTIGVVLQVIFALLVLKVPLGQKFFQFASNIIDKLLQFTTEGTAFVFGDLVNVNKIGFIFALQVLPTIIFFSALMSILYHLGVMQFFISIISKGLAKILGTSGAETLSAVANIFVSQNEAPLIIKPYMEKMTKSELYSVMVGGMATVAGSVMAGYVAMGVSAGHLLAASVMSAPASLVIAKIMTPETEEPLTKNSIELKNEKTAINIIEAAANGAMDGIQIAFNVGGLLIAFIALIALLNFLLGWLGGLVGADYLSLSWIFGKLFSPVAYIMGIPAKDIAVAGDLLGQKVVLNEFVAYANLSPLIASGQLTEKTIVILTYALCGFANFSSIAIQIASIGGVAPGKRRDVAKLGLKAVLGGSLAAFMTAAIAGVLL